MRGSRLLRGSHPGLLGALLGGVAGAVSGYLVVPLGEFPILRVLAACCAGLAGALLGAVIGGRARRSIRHDSLVGAACGLAVAFGLSAAVGFDVLHVACAEGGCSGGSAFGEWSVATLVAALVASPIFVLLGTLVGAALGVLFPELGATDLPETVPERAGLPVSDVSVSDAPGPLVAGEPSIGRRVEVEDEHVAAR